MYVVYWCTKNTGTLFEVMLQNDDARIILVPFLMDHAFPALMNDPVMVEMKISLSLYYQWLYQIVMLFTDVYAASKVVQICSLAIVISAGLVLIRSVKAGWAAGLLLIFLFFHSDFPVNRWAGGLPRGFAFPCLFLWCAGAWIDSFKVRMTAAITAATLYPPVMVLMFGAEGIHTWTYFLKEPREQWWRRVRGYGIQVVICASLLFANSLREHVGRFHTYEEAMKIPAFKKGGRLIEKEQVPFKDPAPILGRTLMRPLSPSGTAYFGEVAKKIKSHQGTWGIFALAAMFSFLLIMRARPPTLAICMLISAFVSYGVARMVAFTFYTPLRYLEFGTYTAVLLLMIECFALWGVNAATLKARNIRTLMTLMLVICTLLFIGDGIKRDNYGMTIKYANNAKLWDAIRKTPEEGRILAHPKEADGVTFWTGRASTVAYERLVPWNTVKWKRNKKRAEEALTALYETDKKRFLAYCEKNKITHVIKKKQRYAQNLKRYAGTFQPLTAFTGRMLINRKPKDVVLNQVPREAIVLDGRKQLISVEKLKQAWSKKVKPPVQADEPVLPEVQKP